VLPLFQPVAPGREVAIGAATVRLRRAGHILGAASAEVTAGGTTVLFSGDLGQVDDPICEPPEHPGPADAIVMESTYGDRLHGGVDAVKLLAGLVRDVAASGGTLLIPAFAVGRVQALLLWLERVFATGAAPPVPVVVDSPMAASVTGLYQRHHADHRLTAADCARIFGLARFVRKVEESKALADQSGPLVLISASGMITGGRVLHHFKRVAPDPASILLLPGFQAPGTRGAALLAGAKEIKVHGAYVPVRARVEHVDAFSAHADRDGLLAWLGAAAVRPKQVVLVHGEPVAADSLRRSIEQRLALACTVAEHGQQLDFG
jgi:metallo-beta-lactamase family protein